jgi:hypothetical protein
LSSDRKIDPLLEFNWPDKLPDDIMWMPEELMTIYGTEAGAELSESEKIRLSQTESLCFYSFNVHGERHLLRDVLSCMHTPGYEHISDYLHYFVAEENVHSWFFQKFCCNYGGKVYPDRRISFAVEKNHVDVDSFFLFARILILEEMLDYYNIKIAADESMPSIIRKINHVHHTEECRHVAIGRNIVSILFDNIVNNHSQETVDKVRIYVEQYIQWCINSLYNPIQYSDAGIGEPYKFRNRVMDDPARKLFHNDLTLNIRKFFYKCGVLKK